MTIEEFKTTITLLSAVVIPVVLAYVGNSYTQALKEREIQAQFVKIAVEILQSQPSEHNRNVREWATQIINRYSGVPLTAGAKRDLIENVPITALEFGRKFSSSIPANDISQAQEDLRTLGLYTGEITGTADEATIKAIIEFQRNEKMAPDGALGVATKSKLRERAAAGSKHR